MKTDLVISLSDLMDPVRPHLDCRTLCRMQRVCKDLYHSCCVTTQELLRDDIVCDLRLVYHAQKNDVENFYTLWNAQTAVDKRKCDSIMRSFYGQHAGKISAEAVMDTFKGQLKPFDMRSRNAVLENMIKRRNIRASRILIVNMDDDSDFSINASLSDDGCTALHLAAKEGSAKMIELLLSYGALLDVQDKYGMTPLYVACRHKNVKAAKCLIWHGANLNTRANHDETALDEASKQELVSVVKLLLIKGADTKDQIHLWNPLCNNNNVEIVSLFKKHKVPKYISIELPSRNSVIVIALFCIFMRMYGRI